MYANVLLSLLKISFLKLKYFKRLYFCSYKQILSYDTEVKIGKKGLMTIGQISTKNNVHIVCVDGNVTIGKGVSFNRNCILIARRSIIIGDNCSFGPNVCIYDHDHMYTSSGLSKNEYKTTETKIGSGCWIGAGVIILRGSNIGRNCVIGAGAIIKDIIPDGKIVIPHRGNEVRTIKS